LIEAVIFDYGLVLSGPRAQWAIDAALGLTGLERAQFEEVYWRFREDYDRGLLDGASYWRRSLTGVGITATSASIDELVWLDGQMWCTANEALVQWHQRLRSTGVKTAILSNMGDAVRHAIERECSWVHAFDVRVWSHEVRRTKPDPLIYDAVLASLAVEPAQALFLDDREENVTAAKQLGMHALVYSTIDQLRNDQLSIHALSALPPA
jgi:putative hydrolase of the HAD superfamily